MSNSPSAVQQEEYYECVDSNAVVESDEEIRRCRLSECCAIQSIVVRAWSKRWGLLGEIKGRVIEMKSSGMPTLCFSRCSLERSIYRVAIDVCGKRRIQDLATLWSVVYQSGDATAGLPSFECTWEVAHMWRFRTSPPIPFSAHAWGRESSFPHAVGSLLHFSTPVAVQLTALQ
jgi:hypothetical protein